MLEVHELVHEHFGLAAEAKLVVSPRLARLEEPQLLDVVQQEVVGKTWRVGLARAELKPVCVRGLNRNEQSVQITLIYTLQSIMGYLLLC